MTTTVERYRELRASGLGQAAACSQLKREGVSQAEAVAACWKAETGRKAPHPEDQQANARWERGATRSYLGHDE